MSSKHIDANKVFELHDDIRHVIVADSMGDVINIFSKAKKTWPLDVQRQFSGIMAAVVFGISEKVRDIAGNVEYIVVHHEKLKIIIAKSANNIYIVSTRKSLPDEIIDKLVALIKSEG